MLRFYTYFKQEEKNARRNSTIKAIMGIPLSGNASHYKYKTTTTATNNKKNKHLIKKIKVG